MLKAMLDKEKYDGLDDVIKALYKEKDGKYILDVQKTDGLGLENVDGLKSTVEKLRASEKSLQIESKASEDALKAAQTIHKEFVAKFDGVDPEAAKEALGKIKDIKNWDGETKVKEAVQLAVQQIETKMQTKLDEVVKQNATKVEGLQTELGDSQDQLQEAVVTSKIVEAISKENGNVDVLMPHVRSQVKMIKDVHGKFKPEVQKADGTARIGGSDGADMTIIQLVQEMKGQETFAGCFPGANATGTGKSTSTENTGTNKATNEKVINVSDTKAISNSLEKIASGEVKVDMTL